MKLLRCKISKQFSYQQWFLVKFYSSSSKLKYVKYFHALDLDDNSSQEVVRRRYIQLVKKFHPDSKTTDSSMERFLLIDEAYRMLQQKFMEDKQAEEDCIGEYGLYYDKKRAQTGKDNDESFEHPDIRHTAPQHRQYLDNEGFGYGTPAQRQRQYAKFRAARAIDNVYKHRMDRLASKYETRLATTQREMTKDQVTKNAMDRLVEDMIKESMSNGEFDNLAGAGKPLPERVTYNPYMDFTSHKMNEILVEGGFAPEWIMLKKDIIQEMQKIRQILSKNRAKLGTLPLTKPDYSEWQNICFNLRQKEVKDVNKMIDKYNLVVPMMNSQMFHFQLDKEAERILSEVPEINFTAVQTATTDNDNSKNIFFILKSKLTEYL